MSWSQSSNSSWQQTADSNGGVANCIIPRPVETQRACQRVVETTRRYSKVPKTAKRWAANYSADAGGKIRGRINLLSFSGRPYARMARPRGENFDGNEKRITAFAVTRFVKIGCGGGI